MQALSKELERFNYLSSEIAATYHEAAQKLGLSDSAMTVLYTICGSGGECLLRDIVRLSEISKQTVNSAIRKLEADGVLYLTAFNGREKIVRLTESGKLLTANTTLKIINIENEIFNSWEQRERDIYISLTQKYLIALKEKFREL